MFIDWHILLSQVGTTQGEPLAMANQIWYADDASATSKFPDLQILLGPALSIKS